MAWLMDADGIQQWVPDTGGKSPAELGLVQVNPEGHPVQEGSLGINQQSYLWKDSSGNYYITPYDGTGKSVAPQKVPAVTDADIPGILSGATTVSKQADAANKAGFNRDVGLAAAVMGGVGAANAGLFGPTSIAGAGTPGAAGGLSDAAIADIVAAEGGYSALPSSGMAGTAGASALTQAAAPVVEKSFNAGLGDKLVNSSPGNILESLGSSVKPGLANAATSAPGGGSIWDEIAKAVGITTTAAGGANTLKDVIGGLIGGYQSGEVANTYADAMKSAMDKYSETMKYAVDQSDPFRDQRGQYQTQLADIISGKTTSANNPNMIDTSTNNPYYMSMDQNNPNMMSLDPNNSFMMSTSKENNPWLADTDINGLLNSPLMANLRDTTIDNTMRRLSSKYGGDASSLGVVNEVAKQVNAANAPLALDYYKSGLTNNQQYLDTASGNNQKYLGTAAANNQAYLGTAANNNQNLMKTAYGNNLDFMKTVGTAAGMNIQPSTGQVAQAGANGLADIMQNYANNQVPLQNQTNGNYGYAANAGLDWLFKNLWKAA